MVDKTAFKSPNTEFLKFISNEIESLSEELYAKINKPIHDNPELGFQEKKAHETLTAYMSTQAGWEVTKSAYGVETAFRASFTNVTSESGLKGKDTAVSINAEYDALPGVGHACGHNLIATGAVAASLAIAKALVHFDLPGSVVLFGTPAEEGGGGKVKLLEAGAYDDVDVSLMIHPGNMSPGTAWGHTTANNMFTCEFFGKAAHAAADPWDGINALDAQVIYYNCVSVLRQQFQPGDLIHGNILSGGAAPNVIANYTKNAITIRSKTRTGLAKLKERIINCVKAAALATGCTYKLTELMTYYDMISNDPMCDVYRDYYNSFCLLDGKPFLNQSEWEKINGEIGASSDQGNVSYALPSIQPMFTIYSPDGANHNEHFAAAAGTKDAHVQTMKAAKALALTGLEIVSSKELLDSIKKSWEDDLTKTRPDVTMY